MSIASAITALNPYLYWKLDQTSGNIAVDSGTAAKNGTVSGDFAWGVTGSEIGTTGIRLFAGAQIISPAIGALSTTNYSLMFFSTVPAQGGISTTTNVLGLGDFANQATRGVRVGVSSPSVDSLGWVLRGPSTGAPQVNPGVPRAYWHHCCWTTTSTPSISTLPYADGTLQTAASVLGAMWTTTDVLWIQGNTPIVLQHVALFNRVLTQAEIQSVANQIQPWPYHIPGDQPPVSTSGGGGGGLTEEQATQLNEIHGWTDDIPGLTAASSFISDTVNTINGKVDQVLGNWNTLTTVVLPAFQNQLNDIQSAVTATVQDGKDLVLKTIGELLSTITRDPFAQVSLTGGSVCTRIDLDVSGSRIYGLVLVITAWPPEWKFGTPDQGWGLRDLAVIRLYHDQQLIERHGVHTTMYTLEPIPQRFLPWFGPFVPLQEAGTRITVDFADGVCGELFASQVPS